MRPNGWIRGCINLFSTDIEIPVWEKTWVVGRHLAFDIYYVCYRGGCVKTMEIQIESSANTADKYPINTILWKSQVSDLDGQWYSLNVSRDLPLGVFWGDSIKPKRLDKEYLSNYFQ
jgi:hypothetical protein